MSLKIFSTVFQVLQNSPPPNSADPSTYLRSLPPCLLPSLISACTGPPECSQLCQALCLDCPYPRFSWLIPSFIQISSQMPLPQRSDL